MNFAKRQIPVDGFLRDSVNSWMSDFSHLWGKHDCESLYLTQFFEPFYPLPFAFFEKQLISVEAFSRDSVNGLLYHSFEKRHDIEKDTCFIGKCI